MLTARWTSNIRQEFRQGVSPFNLTPIGNAIVRLRQGDLRRLPIRDDNRPDRAAIPDRGNRDPFL